MHGDRGGAKQRRRKPVLVQTPVQGAIPGAGAELRAPEPAPKKKRVALAPPPAPVSDVGMQTRQPARATPHQKPIVETPQRYAARELHNPRPNPAEDLRVLGFVGASELTKSRARLQAYINALHRQQMAQQAVDNPPGELGGGSQSTEQLIANADRYRATHHDSYQTGQDSMHEGTPEGLGTKKIIGKSLFNLATTGHTSDPFGAALEAGTMFSGPFKILGAVGKGAEAARAGETAAEIARAARAGHAAPGIIPAALSPISKAAGRMKLRTFEVGGHTVQIPAAGSRSGRVIERAADRIRDNVPGLKSTAAKAGRELGYSVEHVQAPTKNTYANALKQASRRLSAPQEYALRIVAEGATPEQRIAFHNSQAMIATRKDQVYYHALHADITEKAQKYVKLVHNADGRTIPVLSDYAPKKLQRAWELFQQAGDMREKLIKDMGLISDQSLARRVHAPARIINGARYKTFEKQIKDALDASPARKALFDAIDKTASTPQAAAHDKTLWDAAIRAAASRAKLPPEELSAAVDASYAHISAVRTGISDVGQIPGVALHQSSEGRGIDRFRALSKYADELMQQGTAGGRIQHEEITGVVDSLEHEMNNLASLLGVSKRDVYLGNFTNPDLVAIHDKLTEFEGFFARELANKTAIDKNDLLQVVRKMRDDQLASGASDDQVTEHISRMLEAHFKAQGIDKAKGFAREVTRNLMSEVHPAATFPWDWTGQPLGVDVVEEAKNLPPAPSFPGVPTLSGHTDPSILEAIDSSIRDNQAAQRSIGKRGFGPGDDVIRNHALDAGIQAAIKADDYETAQVLHNALTKGTPGFKGDVPERTTLLQTHFGEGFPQVHPYDQRGFEQAAQKYAAELGVTPTPKEIEAIVRRFETQRGGALEKVSPYGIKGAISITDKAAVLHLTTAADDTTLAHELGHFMRAFLTDNVKFKQVAKYLGVKKGVWDRAAEEKFARSLEQVIRTGNGPRSISEALRGLAPVFREVYSQADLPDVPPHVARFIQRLFEYDKKAGGSLVGADDLAVGMDYAPTFRGVPVRLSRPGKAFSAYMKRAGSGINHLFSGGRAGRAIGAGPQDAALAHEYQGSLLLSGFFTFDVTAPKIDASMLATKMSLAHIARKALVEAGTELPQSEFDFAVKVDPTKNVSQELKAAWAKINSLHAGENDPTLLEGTTNDLLTQALHSVVPDQIDGKRYSDVAREVMQTQTPVDNIVWVHPDFLEHSDLLTVPGASKASTDTMRVVGSKVMFGYDALNDAQKALVLYLNPAYVPMQFIGNVGMNVLQQGAFMPLNIWRSVLMHREMDPVYRVFMDTKMGTGSALALPMVTSGSKVLSATLGHWANVASDLLPRRLAFIHEARKLGLKPKHFPELFDKALAGDKEAEQVVDYITRRAKRAIVDFDRMSRLEREAVTRFIWFYPWLRGATDYSVHFIADHPVQSIALALAYEHLQVAQHNKLGDQPYFTKLDVPISTESLGLKVPGTGIDVGLNQVAGEHTATFEGGPQVFSLRQMLTQTTPLELAQSLISFAGGGNYEAAGDVAQHLTPIPYAAAVAGIGYDPFRRQEVQPGLATFFSQLTPADSPIWQRYTHLNMSPEERKKANETAMHPRSKGMEWERLFGGSLAPSGYNKRRAQELALKHQPTLARRIATLKLAAQDAGVPQPDAKVLAELTIKTKLDQAVHDLGKDPSSSDLAKTVATFFDQEYPGHDMSARVSRVRTEGEAKRIYDHLRPRLYRTYSHYQTRIDRLQARKAARTPVSR